MNNYFNNKVVVVTGASRGIGRCLVYELLSLGAKVAGVARSKNLLDEISMNKGSLNGEFMGVICDISDRRSVAFAITAITEKFGTPDILINNAGIGLSGPALQVDKEDIIKCFNVNIFGAVNFIDCIAPDMIKRGSGTIVNVTSIVAKYGLPSVSFYSASKAALSAYSQAIRTELAPAGINIITVYPGNTDTDFQTSQITSKNYVPKKSFRKQLSPEYVAKKILHAIRKKKAEIVIGHPARMLILMKSLSQSLVEYMLNKEFGIARWYRIKSQNKENSFSGIDECIKPGVALGEMNKPCHYHNSTEFINWWNILPEGLQPFLYYVLYPYLLTVAYGGDIPIDQGFRNLATKDAKPVFISRKSLYLSDYAKNFVKTLLSPVLPMGRIKTIPQIETGDEIYPFDLGKEGTLCPAAFRSFFPFLVHNNLQNKKETTKCTWKVCCPDHLKNLVYGEGNPDDTFFESICFWGRTGRIETKSLCKANSNISSGSLDEIMEKLRFPCSTLFNVMYGYYLTLAKGGELGFYTKSFDSAVAQCPNPKSRVVMEIYRRTDTIDFKAVAVAGQLCPRGIKTGNTFSLPMDVEKNGFCLDAFNSLFLYCGLAKFYTGPLTVNCVIQNCDASWQVCAVN